MMMASAVLCTAGVEAGGVFAAGNMASHMLTQSAFAGQTCLVRQAARRVPRAGRPARLSTVAMGTKKINAYDKDWSKGFFGTGYFREEADQNVDSYLKRIEKKKILSGVEGLGLLSKAEKAGLTLTQIEKLGLLSTAERLGLLTTLEKLLVAEPGQVSSLSIPFLLATLGALVVIPDDNVALAVVKYTTAALLGGVAVTFFAGGFLLASLQDD
ncbi:hypothetical protein WJX72_009598 [[Myrmecia] bisecta]|uniref:Uncharacterized protein n=1 Tax=[Myrmecia] bisecta TaxID=41462 RepID=A0AAW1PYL3_9CHLO